MLVVATAQEVQHLLNDHGHILSICDPEQQFKSLREKTGRDEHTTLDYWELRICRSTEI